MITHVHFIHHSHTDFGYTDEPSRVLIQQVQYLDRALELIENTRDKPAHAQFYWTIEASMVAREFVRREGRAGKKRVMDALGCGQLEMAGFLCQPIPHLQSLEELRENFRWAVEFCREAGAPCRVAILDDVGSAPWALADVLAENGIQLLVLAPGGYRVLSLWSELPPIFWWVGPQGGRVLFYTYHHPQPQPLFTQASPPPAPYGFGDVGFVWPARVQRKAAGAHVLPTPADEFLGNLGKMNWTEVRADKLLAAAEKNGYPCAHFLVQAASDNAGPDPNLPADIQWLNQTLQDRQIIFGRAADFLEQIMALQEVRWPVLKGDLHCSWSDQAACLTSATAHYREATRLLQASLRLSHRTRSQKWADGLAQELFDLLLRYSDHTFGLSAWGSGLIRGRGFGPWNSLARFYQDTWKEKETIAFSAWCRGRQLFQEVQAVCLRKWPPDGELFLVNTLDRPSSPQVITCQVASENRPLAYLQNKKEVPVQAEFIRSRWWQIWVPVPALCARQVLPVRLEYERDGSTGPAIGGHTHSIAESGHAGSACPVMRMGDQILTFDRENGRCVSWRSSKGQERLTVEVGHGLGELVHSEVAGIPEDGRGGGLFWPIKRNFSKLQSVEWLPESNGPHTCRSLVRRKLLTHSGSWVETVTEWRLFRDQDAVQVTVHLDKPRCVHREDARVAFPFEGKLPEVIWEQAGAVVGWKDLLPGSHTGWLTIQNWIAITVKDGFVVLVSWDAPLMEVGGMTAETWRGHEKSPDRSVVYSYVLNNFYQTNTAQWQGGDASWRYELRWFPGPLDRARIQAWVEERNLGILIMRRPAQNA